APEEIRPLTRLVRPHIAVITTIAPAHLEALGSLDAIARAKAEIFSGLEPGGTAILNADHGQLDVLLEEARAAGVGRIVTYGEARGVDWQIVNVESLPESCIATVEYDGQQYQVLLNVPGRHMVANAVGAL